MKLPRRRFLRLASGAAAAPAVSRVAWAQSFPAGPVTLIVPWGAGGTVDTGLRVLAAATERHLGHPIVIRNEPGASGTYAPGQMANRAKPDGYTVAQVHLAVLRAPSLRRATYDPSKDFTYIIQLTGYTFGVVVRNDAPWTTFAEFLADAKANPGKINFGSPGSGTTPQLTMQLISRRQGIDLVPVPFSSFADEISALLGGHIHALAEATGWAPQVNAGQFRLLVTWGANRTKNWPNVPTLREMGIDMVVTSPYGIAGPQGMDSRVVKILHDAFKKGMEETSYVATIAKFDQELMYLNSEDYRNFALRQIAEEKRVVEELGLREQ